MLVVSPVKPAPYSFPYVTSRERNLLDGQAVDSVLLSAGDVGEARSSIIDIAASVEAASGVPHGVNEERHRTRTASTPMAAPVEDLPG
ncbi:unnamed protein product [Phytophthora fragariaefolia]|uniref:Unnamed protein product n=1 Tax=Phytophthora fragariaefolia TaxID=1490495 RepID=A0A9W6XY20_9STRA|nr:unnamed protein product [Phytophthora fragariaefolia]